MHLFKWTKANAVFLPQVDAEHRNLYRIADELHQAVLAGMEQANLQPQLQSLLSVIEDHLTHEERLMRSVSYPSFDWHKKQHDTLRNRTRECCARIDQGDTAATVELLQFLSHWLRDHTGLADRMMGAFLRNRERLSATVS